MVLINPPQVRNCEPPVALAHLAGSLIEAGEPVTIIDGALEAYLWLCEQPAHSDSDRKAARVRRNKQSILHFNKDVQSIEKYKKRISDIKYLATSSQLLKGSPYQISPSDYHDSRLSPLKSSDLIHCWENPGENLFFPWFSKRIRELFKDNPHSHVGISVGFLSQALTAIAICGWIKQEFPQIKTILGGSLINSWIKSPADTDFLNLFADKIHSGSGEREIVEFTGKQYKGDGIPNFTDLYSRSVSADYLSPGRILPYSTALGCSWRRCTFCSETYENNPHCEKSPLLAVKQLKELTERYEPELIHLCDSEISRDFILQIIENPPGVGWYGFSRFLNEMTDIEYCRKLASSGCRMLCLGLESGDQNVLNKLKKGIKLDKVSPILQNLKEAGILTYIYIMFGTPEETEEAAVRTRDFIVDHSECISFLNASIFNMPIGSSESRDVISMEFYKGDLSIYKNFIHPRGWSRGQVRRFLEKDIKKNPEIRKILSRTPPVFTSSHAAFFSLPV